MKSITHIWSGDHRTVIDIGSNDVLLSTALSIAIDSKIKMFKSLCENVYKNHKYDTLGSYFIRDAKYEIRKLRQLKHVVNCPVEIYDQKEAREAVSKFV